MIAFPGVSSLLSSAAVGRCCGGCSCALARVPRMAQPRINVSTKLVIEEVLGGSLTPLLETEKVADFHEELAAVVDVPAGRVCHVSGRSWGRRDHIQILQVAVIADINRGARMHEVRDQEIGVEFTRRRQIRIRRSHAWRSSQQGVVLQNHTDRELRSELPVPLATQNMVVEDSASGAGKLRLRRQKRTVSCAQAVEKICVLDLQRLEGT